MVVEIDHPLFGKFKLGGNPIKASETEDVFAPPPQHGEFTVTVLKEILGYPEDKINQLKGEKAIGVLEEKNNGE
jgi:crotonobetainyl-CoA:carnitine CoA-transferase CaiB-like acyl-CoA transferase